jgi:hypothetical protein
MNWSAWLENSNVGRDSGTAHNNAFSLIPLYLEEAIRIGDAAGAEDIMQFGPPITEYDNEFLLNLARQTAPDYDLALTMLSSVASKILSAGDDGTAQPIFTIPLINL